MSTITKEWLLKTITELEEERDATPGAVNEDAAKALAAMKLALASLEAEPVAWRHFQKTPTYVGYWILNDYKPNCSGVEPLYTAPPAPESVPDGVLKSLLPDAEKSEFWFEHDGKILFEGVKFNNAVFDACRAAMLQGANDNSPVIQDGWVACSERMPERMVDVITSNGFDTGKGWWDGDNWKEWHKYDAVPGKITHWMPLPAAPQQEDL